MTLHQRHWMRHSSRSAQGARAGRILLPLLVLAVIAGLPRPLPAHHAKEYVRTESFAQTPRLGLALFNGLDYYRTRFGTPREDTWEYTPTLAFGLHDRLMLDVHAHLLQTPRHDPFMEAMAFALQQQLTRPGSWRVDVALNIQYELPFARSREILDGRHNLMATLILGRELPHDINVTANVHYTRFFGQGGWNEVGYNLATKGHVIPSLRWLEAGLELLGSIGESPTLALVPGVYIAPAPFLVFKVGVSFGLTSSTEALGIHAIVAVNRGFGRPVAPRAVPE